MDSDKYKATTFLTGLFCKFRLYDKETRKIITELYGQLINTVLKKVSDERKILIFKSLIPAIKNTTDYFEHIRKEKKSPDEELLKTVRHLIAHHIFLIQEIGIRMDESSVFDNIMKQVHIDDIACEIGECVKLYRETNSAEKRADIVNRLKVLLNDYNVVEGTHLKLNEVLKIDDGEVT